ncbi:MAG: Phosphate regulon sensor protein PhoR (SphS) [uncultured Propionibacteriaceae bacterium]|uniref:Sensor-like histidine kinase SenX3 n=1 Tax=uncultured Propionibacteriaceae bacterium TaxID=257457 RepID=A0A6J4P3W8_9ACTN|nr:MAG: Phosphate regulon sensor protein PhoR (SphS) [uncultured Propionibacteriaceae bacterium]
MNPTLTALAFVLGVLVGAVVFWLVQRRPAGAPVPDFEADEATVVPEGVAEVLAVLRSSAIVVGPHDEVLQASTPAYTLGLVRGSRVAVSELLELVRAVRRDDAIRTADLEVKRGPGAAATYLSARVAPLAEDMIVVLAEDRTAERRIEATRRDFVANVSHELKTPIGAISLLAEAVQDAADDPPAVRKFAARMGIESARLTELVAQIIELSRLQADNPLSQAEVVDIDQVLNEAVDRCRVDADEHGVSLTIAGQQHCRVLGSARQLEVAVGNLVENAVIYSDEGARVVVAAHMQARSDDDYVEITVSDNGIGIPAADQQRIFERFYRVDYARSRANGGTGLGLSIVKHIAAVHGGQVSVWSQPARGSTFTLSIPAHLHRDGGVDVHRDDRVGSDRDDPVESDRADAAEDRRGPHHVDPPNPGLENHHPQESTR